MQLFGERDSESNMQLYHNFAANLLIEVNVKSQQLTAD